MLPTLTNVTNNSVIMHCDNQGAIKLVHNPVFHERTKHIEVRYHFMREVVEDGIVKIVYLSTDNMTADIMTKALCYPLHS
jgi:hypothetical protein